MSNQKKKDYFFQLISVFAVALKFIDSEATKIHRNQDNIVIKFSIKNPMLVLLYLKMAPSFLQLSQQSLAKT